MANTSSCVDPMVSAAFKALAFEADLIQGYGEYQIRTVSSEIKDLIPQEPGNPNEGCDPIEHVEYSFWGTDCDYGPVVHCADNVEGSIQVPSCNGTLEALDINQNDPVAGAPGLCDPPTCVLQAGHNIYRGVEWTRACESPVICLHELIRKKHVRPYLEGLRGAMPREMDRAFCHKLWEELINFGTNLSETGPGCLNPVVGSYNAVPTGTIDYGTLLQHQEMLLAQGYPGKPVYLIGHAALRQMILNHKQNNDLQLNVTPYGDDFEFRAQPGGMISYGDIDFRILKVPIRGYIQQIGAGPPGVHEFRRIENRRFVAGTGAGAVMEYDTNFQTCKYICDGNAYDVVELIAFAHPMAFKRRPYAAPQMGFGENLNGAFNMEVKIVGGAHIECNPDEDKFKLRAKHHFRFVPKNPRWGGTIAHLYTPYQRFLNAVPCDECPEGQNEQITVRPFNRGECEDPCCYDAVGAPQEGAGEFYISCDLTIAQGETTATVCVDRRNGTNGAASLQGDTADGTATAGVDYTAVVAGALNWADGEGGVKCLTVPGIVQPAAGGDLTFDVDWTLAVGAAIAAGVCTTTTVTIQQLPA